jgi:SnoaL-like domain
MTVDLSVSTMDATLHDELLIRRLIDRWAVWRDAGDWARFRTVWHPDGLMMATWFQGPFEDFIRVTQEGWARGVSILHFLGGSAIEVVGERAVAMTKMTISQRGLVEGVLCDVVCTGRFYDFVAKHEGQWKLLHRQPIYEKDRVDALDPAAVPQLNATLLATFPEGYRHLAYIQTRIGYRVKLDMPMLKGPQVEALYARGARWLAGGELER